MSKSDIPDEIVDYACGCKGERRGVLWSMSHCGEHGHIVEAPEPHITVTLPDDQRSADVVFNDAFWKKLTARLILMNNNLIDIYGPQSSEAAGVCERASQWADAMGGQEDEDE